MKKALTLTLAASLATLALAGCKQVDQPAAEAPKADADDPIASAMSAAPEAVGAKATIVAVAEDGSMQTLREGTNGFTCMPDNPVTPGPDPMCMDANALKWGMAWMAHEDPPEELPGFMYMLAGGTDASNTDPFAAKPADGENWIETGPHVMIVGSMKALEGYPTDPQPDTSQPYAMWSGTPYAHLMIPVS